MQISFNRALKNARNNIQQLITVLKIKYGNNVEQYNDLGILIIIFMLFLFSLGNLEVA